MICRCRRSLATARCRVSYTQQLWLQGNRFTGGSGNVLKKFCGKPKMDRPKMNTKLKILIEINMGSDKTKE